MLGHGEGESRNVAPTSADTGKSMTAVHGGLVLNWVSYSDEATGAVLQKVSWAGMDPLKDSCTVTLPASIQQCESVTRTLSFSSLYQIDNFCTEQVVYLDGTVVERLPFTFGFVIPKSTNTWACTVKAAPAMIPAEHLSGRMVRLHTP